MSEQTSAGGGYARTLPRLDFPFATGKPDVYIPQNTILRLPDGAQIYVFLWCYLDRKTHGTRYTFQPSSLSEQRIQDIPATIECLSKLFQFDNARPRSVAFSLATLSRFLNWLDETHHQRRYEAVLSDPDLALDAIKKFHSHLRQRIQVNDVNRRLGAASASAQNRLIIKIMSAIHQREYGDEVENITCIPGEGVRAPKTEDVAAFMACAQGVFDSVVRIVFHSNSGDFSNHILRWHGAGQERSIGMPRDIGVERLMELGCVAYAALCIGDSGSNLASLQVYEEPEDMHEQLDNPEKISLRQKVIKFRAGGKDVPIHLTSTTTTRLRSYLRIREALRVNLDCLDVKPMFIQGRYDVAITKARPLKIIPLDNCFNRVVRDRFGFFGINLPSVTLQQLRSHKQARLAKENNPKVAADIMGHSVSTAIRKYDKITEVESRTELAPFLASLTSIVLNQNRTAESTKVVTSITAIPVGSCTSHSQPIPLSDNAPAEPNCKRAEGCFFCDKYQVHADQEDSIKLMSCRTVLKRLPSAQSGTYTAERVYTAVLKRIDILLNEINRLNPEAHERARVTVMEEGKLSRYWASKMQQLHLLGILPP